MRTVKRKMHVWLTALFVFAIAFLALGTTREVWAATVEVNDENTLRNAVVNANSGDIVKLAGDISLTAGIDVAREITLDLNGYTITDTDSSDFTGDYLLAVWYGGNLTVTDSSSARTGSITTTREQIFCGIKMTVPNYSYNNNPAVLTVEHGTIQGYYYGISGNGKRNHTQVTINGGTVKGYCQNDSTGIYQPQGDSTLTIHGGTIIGATGVEIRSGTLTVTGGTIRGDASHFEVNPNGKGTTTIGAGIAIAQHVTQNNINVSLEGGTVVGQKDISYSNPQGNPDPQVTIMASRHFVEGASPVLPEDCKWEESNGVYTIHQHSFGEADWRWVKANNKWTAASTYTCTAGDCGDKVKLTATVTGTDELTAVDSFGNSSTYTPESYTVTYNGNSGGTYKWGEIATFTASGIASWSVDGKPIAGGLQTYSFAVTRNCELTSTLSPASAQTAAVITNLTANGPGKAVFRVRWYLPVGSKVKSAIIYRGHTGNSNEAVTLDALKQYGTEYDTGLRTSTGDFTLELKNLTAGTWQHVVIEIHYILNGQAETLVSGTKSGDDYIAEKLQVTGS